MAKSAPRYKPQHSQQMSEARPSAYRRGYDKQWQAFRDRWLQEWMWCHDCHEAGRLTLATEVHHKQKVAGNKALKYERSNLMSLCRSCHSARTARGE